LDGFGVRSEARLKEAAARLRSGNTTAQLEGAA